MRLLAVRIGLAVAANAIALFVAAVILDDFEIDLAGFVFAVAIFSAASLLVRPIVRRLVVRHAEPFLGVIGLVVTFAVLVVTDILSDGITISGVATWVLATVIVWLSTAILDFVPGPWRRARLARRAA